MSRIQAKEFLESKMRTFTLLVVLTFAGCALADFSMLATETECPAGEKCCFRGDTLELCDFKNGVCCSNTGYCCPSGLQCGDTKPDGSVDCVQAVPDAPQAASQSQDDSDTEAPPKVDPVTHEVIPAATPKPMNINDIDGVILANTNRELDITRVHKYKHKKVKAIPEFDDKMIQQRATDKKEAQAGVDKMKKDEIKEEIKEEAKKEAKKEVAEDLKKEKEEKKAEEKNREAPKAEEKPKQ